MPTLSTTTLPHPDYGLAEETRLRVLEDSDLYGIRAAAEAHGLHYTTVYNWRRRYGFVALKVQGA